MDSHCLTPSEIPHTSRLYSLYLEDFSRVAGFYGHAPSLEGVRAAAAEVRMDPAVRSAVVDILREENRRFGGETQLDPSVARNLDRLAAGAVAIVTGQQVGLFSGPAYSFYKAMSAVRAAAELTAQGIEAVPVFWLATEDHDFAEVDHCFWPARGGLVRLALPAAGGAAGNSVGTIRLGERVRGVVASALGSMDGPHVEEIARALEDSYRSAETLGSAFGKLFARLLRGRGVIQIDPMHAALSGLAAPIYRRALVAHAELCKDLLARDKALEAAGLHAQVRVGERSTLLFLNVEGRRTALREKNGGFSAGACDFSLAQLEELFEKSPESFSGNALLRPVVQDSLLPTAGYVAGPAEAAYYAQSAVIYAKLLGRMPAILPRAGFTLVEPTVARLLRKYHLDVRDILQGRQHVRARLERESVPRELARHFSTGDKNLRRYLARLRRPITRLDPTLGGALSTAERKMLYQLDKLRGKAGRAADRREALLDAREQTLRDSLYPLRGLQERSLCLLPFLARHGEALMNELERRALPFEASTPRSCHQVVFL